MILSSAKVADFDQFLQTFSTKGAEKRKEHGSKGSRVFRDPEDASRVWVAFDWEVEDYEKFIADPEVPAIFQEAGTPGSASQGGARRPVQLLREADRALSSGSTPNIRASLFAASPGQSTWAAWMYRSVMEPCEWAALSGT